MAGSLAIKGTTAVGAELLGLPGDDIALRVALDRKQIAAFAAFAEFAIQQIGSGRTCRPAGGSAEFRERRGVAAELRIVLRLGCMDDRDGSDGGRFFRKHTSAGEAGECSSHDDQDDRDDDQEFRQ